MNVPTYGKGGDECMGHRAGGFAPGPPMTNDEVCMHPLSVWTCLRCGSSTGRSGCDGCSSVLISNYQEITGWPDPNGEEEIVMNVDISDKKDMKSMLSCTMDKLRESDRIKAAGGDASELDAEIDAELGVANEVYQEFARTGGIHGDD